MPTEVYLVKVGMTMTEGIVDEWYVADGESVDVGEPVYRLETEKVNMDVEAETGGTVKHLVAAGQTLEPGDVVAWIYANDETIPDQLPEPKANRNISAMTDGKADAEQVTPETVTPQGSGVRRRAMASPAARRLAKELEVDLEHLSGSGPNGRITREDVEAGAKSLKSSKAPAVDTVGDSSSMEPLRGMRKVIAQRMFDSLHSTAQLTIDMEVLMDAAVLFRSEFNAAFEKSSVRITYTDLVVVAVTRALLQHPRLNASLVGDAIQLNSSVNVGIAVALEDGLLVPVIHNTETKNLSAISTEAAVLAERARNRELSVDELSGGTFTVTSLGMYGVDTFTPILNTGETGILGVGRIYDGVRWKAETPVRTQSMRLSLTWDHRVVDGAPAAEFLSDVKTGLEHPGLLFANLV